MDRLSKEESRVSKQRAAKLYLCILQRASADQLSVEDRDAVRKRFSQMVFMLADSTYDAVVSEGDRDEPDEWVFADEAGERLLAWWRMQDVVPSTPGNERLLEHVERVQIAEREYASSESVSGFDDRGLIYVKYGPPSRVDQVNWDEMHNLSMIDGFPENEIWSYPALAQNGSFLFIEDDDEFELGRSTDLIPKRQRALALSPSRRGNQNAVRLLGIMSLVYERLAYYQDHIAFAYLDTWKYASLIEENRRVAQLGGMSYPVNEQPSVVATRIVSEVEAADRNFERRRDKEMPAQATEVIKLPTADLQYITSRFLNPDGTTRVVLDWAMEPEELQPDKSVVKRFRRSSLSRYQDRSVEVNVSIRDPSYQSIGAERQLVVFEDASADVSKGRTNSLTFALPKNAKHLALQTNAHMSTIKEDVVQYGPPFSYAVDWERDLSPLDETGRRLLLSDIRPMLLPRDVEIQSLVGSSIESAATPTPRMEIQPDDQLVIYFEAYNLRYGSDDRVQYTVQYDVEVRSPRWLLRDQFERSSTEVTQEGSSSRVEEYILVDLGDVEVEDGDTIRLTVEMTDDVAQSTSSRTIELDVAEP
ncbi:GWxTD domain-containing protein [Longibacter salinarum]|nr:GWxTD domain-containing protein [Longibacter salinarum]